MRPTLVALFVALSFAVIAHAVEKETGTIQIAPSIRLRGDDEDSKDAKMFNEKQKELLKRAVLVSLIENGKVVRQQEVEVEYPTGLFPVQWEGVPLGRYDIKFEGEGFETVVKRGLQVSAASPLKVIGDLRGGKGTRVIEYGKDGDPLDNVDARLRKLEAAVEALRKGK